jgi:hypothetical protein
MFRKILIPILFSILPHAEIQNETRIRREKKYRTSPNAQTNKNWLKQALRS